MSGPSSRLIETLAVNIANEILLNNTFSVQLALKVSKKYSNCIFFSSKLIFEHDNFITRILHNETPVTLQRHLHLQGKELVILPMKI
mgnify:CR=1 FL=1